MCCSSLTCVSSQTAAFGISVLAELVIKVEIPTSSVSICVMKYIMDATWPMVMRGWVTGWLPIQVRVSRIVIRSQNRNWLSGRNIILCCLDL